MPPPDRIEPQIDAIMDAVHETVMREVQRSAARQEPISDRIGHHLDADLRQRLRDLLAGGGVLHCESRSPDGDGHDKRSVSGPEKVSARGLGQTETTLNQDSSLAEAGSEPADSHTHSQVAVGIRPEGAPGWQPTGKPLDPQCLDCGMPYEQFPLDVLLPRPQWLEIHPSEHGLLCAACIMKRAARVPGVTCAHAILEITPRRPLPTPPASGPSRE